MHVEMTVSAANGAKVFGTEAPFVRMQSTYVVIRPLRWTSKAEGPYAVSHDFKVMHKFVPSNAWPRVTPMDELLVERSRASKKMIATLIFDTTAYAPRFRYFLRAFNTLIASEPIARGYTFSIADRAALPGYLAHRFEHSTIDRTFGQVNTPDCRA